MICLFFHFTNTQLSTMSPFLLFQALGYSSEQKNPSTLVRKLTEKKKISKIKKENIGYI